jgi:proline iminopeptidase
MKHTLARNLSVAVFATLFIFLVPVSNYPQTTSFKIEHPQGDYVMVNGAKLWYESEGKGELLLLITGGPGTSHSCFHPYFSALADSYRVIYFDAFGRGKSDQAKSPKEYTFDRDVEDVEGLRKALGLGKINVLGHSYGGLVAQAYALKYPESIHKLILSNTLFSGEMWQANNDNCNHEIRNQYPEAWEKIEQLRAQGFHSSAKELQEVYNTIPGGLFYYYDASNENKVVIEYNTEVYYAIAGDDADFLIAGDIAKLDFRTELKNLKMPTLILAGRFDRVTLPRFSIQFKQYAPQAEFVMFEKSGHNPYVEEPAKMFEVVRRFLSR